MATGFYDNSEVFSPGGITVQMQKPVWVPAACVVYRFTVAVSYGFLDIEAIHQGFHVESHLVAVWHRQLLRKRLPMKRHRSADYGRLCLDASARGVHWLTGWGFRVRRALQASRALMLTS